MTLYNTETEQTVTYRIVGEDEANVQIGKISVTSPIARAMMGKEEGDAIVVKTPKGDTEYEVEKVEYR